MFELTTPPFWLAVVAIIFVDILLSGDNALVFALAALSPARLRRRRPVGVYKAANMVIEDPLVDPWIAGKARRLARLPLVGFAAVVATGLDLARRGRQMERR